MDAPLSLVLARMTDARLRAAYADTRRRGVTPLMQAVRALDEAAVAALLAAGADVDAVAEGAECALGIAVAAGHEPIVTRLLAAGADATMRVERDRTLLHLAARHASVALVRTLVDAGVRIDADARGESAIDVASRHGHVGIAEVLLDLPMQDRIWRQAFVTACGRGDTALLRLLWVRHETALLALGSAPVMRAADGGHAETIHFLIGLGFPFDEFDLKDERSPLMLAVAAGHRDAAIALLDRGARIDAMTEWGVTAWRLAQVRGDAAMIELLRNRGAGGDGAVEGPQKEPYWQRSQAAVEAAIASDDVEALARMIDRGNTTGPDGTWHPPVRLADALEAAIHSGALHSVGLLLAHGADGAAGLPIAIRAGQAHAVRMLLAVARELPDDLGAHASHQSDPWILRALLERGASAESGKYGRPLMNAALAGRWQHAALLLDHGAHLDEDSNGSSPLLSAATLGHVRCVELLVDRDRSDARQRRIDAALLAGAAWPRVIQAMLRRGANPRARDRDGNTLLHLGAGAAEASIELHLSLVGDLLEAPGRLGWTPLHQAAMSGSLETLEKLLAAGARLDARGERGETPLHLACTYPRAHVIEALLAAGADPQLRDREGRTPLACSEAALSHSWVDRTKMQRAVEVLRAHLAHQR